MEQNMRPLYRATLDALGPLHGVTLLDAGCGSGQALVEAAARGAVVSGLDATPELLLTADRKPDGSLRQDNVLRYVTEVKP
jgi:2-polyprenyl-3-methyl-5-hydroxy-6-metoxy-1,4-benzoquinol methylase